MNIVLAFDSFKGSLPADLACRIAADAIAPIKPDATLIERPMADGGEGTVAALLAARGGEWIAVPATGPLPSMIVDAGFGWLPNTQTAVIEMAAASGITLLRRDQLNPFETTTLGTGELIRAAIEHGAKHIFLALGGSATVDGGIGAAHALGWRFYDKENNELPPIGGRLPAIARVERPDTPIDMPPLTILADVTNPLCGETGAARVFGPQKGATPEQVEQLAAGLQQLAELLRKQHGMDVLPIPGGGAAGGLGAGAVAFMGGTIQSGIDTVMDACHLATVIEGADWVFTGEGQFDEQSLHGKVVSGVTRLARERSAKVALFAGRVALDRTRARAAGVDFATAITPRDMPMDEAMRLAPELLRQAITRFANDHL